jgi:hypothetical protein
MVREALRARIKESRYVSDQPKEWKRFILTLMTNIAIRALYFELSYFALKLYSLPSQIAFT